MKILTKKLKQKWIKALRSEDYAQGIGELHSEDKYCCLGVLEAIDEEIVSGSSSMLYQFPHFPEKSCVVGLPKKIQEKLAGMNDAGDSFETIASWINKNIHPTK